MKKIVLCLTTVLILNVAHSQDKGEKTNNGFTTIGYFSSKNVINVDFKILQLEEYTFLQMFLDESIYPAEDYYSDRIEVRIHLQSGIFVNLEPIDNEYKNERCHLFYLTRKDVERLKKGEITSVEFVFSYTKNYTFKYIKEPDFFKNNLK